MNAIETVLPAGTWGRYQTYYAKVGTMPGSIILIKRVRTFSVDQRIEFCEAMDLRGMSTGCTPTWRSGIVWKIEDNRIFVNI